VCKVGSGFTDEMQEKIHKELKELEIDHAPSNLKYKEKNIDVWLQPTYVWEIKAADLSISPVYVAALGEIEPERGIALRFPRFIRERGDKRVDEATNNEQLLELYKAQAAVNIDFGANDDFDF
jgi:DNA ligase-1